ncbi:MAG TPA: glycosyltransferase family 39 protein [Roseiflexaceae bacterium]|nr:glycosyltransferase family 39 protein [Roseiflexaceae bacterium]
MTPSTPAFSQEAGERGGRRSLRLPLGLRLATLALIGIVLLAAALRLANTAAIGQANTYYTAAVESMLQSWRNFFFVAAEPGGSVSVDKPPVGLWLQAISAFFLGVNGFAVVLPQILAGLASVVLLFHLVRRSFGDAAGLLAALVLAVTPVAIAVERNNTPDGTLIVVLLLAAWAFIRATETSRLRFLILGAVVVGIGFNIKMMQAFLPLPAFYALYLFGAEQPWRRRIVHLFATTLVLVPVALSWAVAVDLTPADQRPYVGGSTTNSVLELALGYNGLQRLTGGGPGGGGQRGVPPQGVAPDQPDGNVIQPPRFNGGRGPMGAGAGGAFGTGEAGPLRLFQSGLAAQASWLLPFGLIMLAAMACSRSWRRPQTTLHRALILWGGWLLTCAVFFSVAGFFHQYYLTMLGAPLAALVAIGVVFLWRLRAEHPGRAALLLLAAVLTTLAFQVYAVGMYQSLAWWVVLPVALGLAGAAALLLGLRRDAPRVVRWGFALLVAALLVVPGVWSGLTTAYANVSGPMPQAYGSTGGMPGAGRGDRFGDGQRPNGQLPPAAPADGMPGFGAGVDQSLLEYLQANTQDIKYLLVVPSSQQGAGYVLATGRPVLYAGGFGGSDPVIDGDSLARLVASGDVRYVLWGGMGGPGGGDSSISSYVQQSCSLVDPASLGVATGSGQGGLGRERASTLYRCGR